MTTETIDRTGVFSRPAARFDAGGNLEVRASAALGCRRVPLVRGDGTCTPTRSPSEESLHGDGGRQRIRAGGGAGDGADRLESRPRRPPGPAAGDGEGRSQPAGHGAPRRHGAAAPAGRARRPASRGSCSTTSPVAPAYGDPMVVEIKTRGPEAFRRWRTLGAERSHPASVAQAAFYTLGAFGDIRAAVIATMDTGSRTWDHEIISAVRLDRALLDACAWLGEVASHHSLHGPDPEVLPERDFSAGSWHVQVMSLPGHLPAGHGRGCRRTGDP